MAKFVGQRETLPITRPTGRHGHHRIEPAVLRSSFRGQPRKPGILFIDHDDQQAQALKGVGEVGNRVHAQLPSVAHQIGECLDLIERMNALRQSWRWSEFQQGRLGECPQKLDSFFDEFDDLDL